MGDGGGGLLTCFIIECRATVGKLNLRSIMHRTWQVLVGKIHFQPLQSWDPGKALFAPAPI